MPNPRPPPLSRWPLRPTTASSPNAAERYGVRRDFPITTRELKPKVQKNLFGDVK